MGADDIESHLVAFEAEERERLDKLKLYSNAELVQELEQRLKWFADMEYRFGCVLDHATGGRMSKTNYDKEAMYAEINDYIQRERDEAFEDGREEGQQENGE